MPKYSRWVQRVDVKGAKTPYVLLLICLGATLAACTFMYRSSVVKDTERFNSAVQASAGSVRSTLLAEVDLAKAVSVLIGTNNDLDSNAFERYVHEWNIGEYYPGLIGIGFAPSVPKSGNLHGASRSSTRAETVERIAYFVPARPMVRRPIGFDLSADPQRKWAMEQARDSGKANASGPIRLSELGKNQTKTSFMLVVPVYRTGGDDASLAGRRASAFGYVFCLVDAMSLETLVFGSQGGGPVSFVLYSGGHPSASTMLGAPPVAFLNPRPRFTESVKVSYEGCSWTARFFSTPSFDSASDLPLVWWVAFNGLLVSLLVCSIALLLANLRKRTETTSRQLTAFKGQLFQEEQRFRALVDGLQDHALFMVGPSGQIKTWNPGVEMVFGYSEREFVDLHVSALYTPEDKAAGLAEAEIAVAVKAGRAREDGWRVRKDGRRIWIAGGASLIRDEAGIVVGIVKVMRDQTDLKEAEAKIREINADLEMRVEERTAQLLEANKDMESFCYTVSHDMRTPLRGIVAASSFVLQDYGDKLPEQGREDLESVVRSAQNVAKLVNDLLEFSRLGKQKLLVQRIDLTALVRKVVDALPLNEPGKKANVQVEEGMVAYASPDLMELVFSNLIENAYKYSKSGKEAFIKVGSRALGEFYVEDHGIGFDMAYASKVFQPFERLHGDLKIPGTGIGLANVRRIVELHGGQVWVESKVDAGSTFWLKIPTIVEEPFGGKAAIGLK